MAMNGAAVVEDRAGITFCVELYVPWDAPKAVVDISLVGVVPLRHIPDVIGLVGRRVLQGRDASFGPRLSWHGPEFSRRYDSGHGVCAGNRIFPFRSYQH